MTTPQKFMSTPPHKFMSRAITLAKRGIGHVEPNPPVGCVIVKNNRIVGEGYHRKFGQPHAEPNALADAGNKAKNATAYITLEPCATHGKTPPCTQALINAQIKHVVIAQEDPTPSANSRGLRQLKKAGITCETGLLRDQAAQLIQPFLRRTTQNLPWIITKWAATLDGAIATRTGDSKWISNPKSRHHVHQTRARVDGIVVGIQTAITDNATLTARNVKIKRTAARIIIDPNARLPLNSNLIKTIHHAPLILIIDHAKKSSPRAIALQNAGATLLPVPRLRSNSLNLKAAMKSLVRKHNVTNLLLEGGSKTIGHFLDAKLINEIHAYVTPKILADPKAILPPLTSVSPPSLIKNATDLTLLTTRRFDGDILLQYGVTTSSR